MTSTATTSDQLLDWEPIYRGMEIGRQFDELAVRLQRQGALDSYGEARGQEAAQMGAVIDLRAGDMVFPSYRQPLVGIHRGVPVIALLRFYAGADFCPWEWRSHGFGPYCTPVGSQCSHAAGWAWASRLRGEDAVTVVFVGDGAASQGEVHEAMNYAAVFEAPVVFVMENNGWAISLPTSRQTRADGLYRRAVGYGMPGQQVDGNDPYAVRKAMAAAVARARSGGGPSIVEACTYRLGGHTTSDDPKRYRSPDELAGWEQRDPLPRLREVLGRSPDRAARADEIRVEVAAELARVADEFLVERGL